MQAGQKLTVRVRGIRPGGGVHDRGAVAQFYAPGRDPEHDPADREPDRVLVLPFDPVTRFYARDVATAGWAPGTWTLRGVVLDAGGTLEGWAWHRFPVEA
jgi:hypothetical protein